MCTAESTVDHEAIPGPAQEPLVAVDGVAKRYARRVAIQNLTLTLQSGEVFGLVGANGGGKTTTLRLLAGLLRPDEGRGHVLGFDLRRGAREIRTHVGYMAQRFSLYADLSVFQNLRFRAEVYGLRRPGAAANAAIDDFELTPFTRSPAGQLSGGWARRLQLAAALIHGPRLLLLDEPTAGLDAISRQDVWRRIGRLAAGGAGIVVSTHDLAEAERCAQVALLADGRVVAAGTPAQVAKCAPAAAFLLSGHDARRRGQNVEALSGVIASYPQGPSLRIVAAAEIEERLQRMARQDGARLVRVAMRLEDAALVFSRAAADGGL
jgi:ABC-2 type transport system ATP-binding protein